MVDKDGLGGKMNVRNDLVMKQTNEQVLQFLQWLNPWLCVLEIVFSITNNTGFSNREMKCALSATGYKYQTREH